MRIGLFPRSASAYNFRGLALEEMGEFQEALQSYEAAIAHDPNFPDAWRNAANVLYQLHRYDEALMVYERLLRLEPNISSVGGRGMLSACSGDEGIASG